MKNIEKTLEQLGLTSKESRVYLTLLELGPTAIRNIAERAGINRGTTYESLKKLQAQEEQDPKFVEFLRQFGQHLKGDFGGWNIFVLTADMALPGQLRIKESKRTPLFNGPLECRLFKFEMHAKRPTSESIQP